MSEDQTPNDATESSDSSYFSSGGFVIGLIIFALVAILISWSVSFIAMIFGAAGTVVSVATCLLDHSKLGFKPRQALNLEDENWAYLAARGVFGMLSGTAVMLLVFTNSINALPWTSVAVVSFVAAFVLDKVVFKK